MKRSKEIPSLQDVVPQPGSAQAKTAQVQEMFDAVAPRYDLLNRLISLGLDKGWRRRCLRLLAQRTKAPQAVLDVAAGTGDMTLALVDEFPAARVVAFDLSAQMLEVAHRRAEGGHLERIEFMQGDIESPALESDSFDIVTCVFGVRNFEHTAAGLEQMHRVLRPGGWCLILETSKPHVPVLRAGHTFHCRVVLPLVGRAFSSNSSAYRYLPRSVEAFPSGEEFAALLRTAGFSRVDVFPLSGGVVTAYLALASGNPKRVDRGHEHRP